MATQFMQDYLIHKELEDTYGPDEYPCPWCTFKVNPDSLMSIVNSNYLNSLDVQFYLLKTYEFNLKLAIKFIYNFRKLEHTISGRNYILEISKKILDEYETEMNIMTLNDVITIRALVLLGYSHGPKEGNELLKLIYYQYPERREGTIKNLTSF